MKQRTRVISIRINESLYELLKEITAERNKLVRNINNHFTIGDTIRDMLQYLLMAYTLGMWNEDLPSLRKRFLEFLK